jgi:flagellar hook-basal body complex protein FliE
MSIEAITALSSATLTQLTTATAPLASTAPASATPFDAVVKTMQDLSTQMAANQQSVESLAVGQSDELHRVIMNMESTKLSFDLALQVRNKALDAYQELMRMQV